MLFSISRIILGIVLFTGLVILIRRAHIVHKQKWIIFALITTILISSVLALIPIENAFITFSSVESSYSYSNQGNVQLIIKGKQSDFVVGKSGDTYYPNIIPKTSNGWKLAIATNSEIKKHVVVDGVTVRIYKHKTSDDYYISIWSLDGEKLEIFDNQNSEFFPLERISNNHSYYTYYAYNYRLDNQYALTVNGKDIIIFDDAPFDPNHPERR